MTSAQIRQSFLDFFKSKQHTIVPSASLLPDSPNLLFTNAGMNQFVPIFLGERKPDVDKWAGAIPALPTRAADTQKCIRAGGKHNDLEDVGLDTYHHTFFEMLGNWSFGDYFKKEAIDWAWELVTEVWKFPKERLYATVYKPGDGDPSELDQEAWDIWAEKFRDAGLDPRIHIVYGNKKDNFWMMGETGPCGPCSELHVDLTPAGDTRGSLVNAGDSRCIEIWNLVFIQFNANPDGTFSPLPSKHVDTGMGFERVTSIIQGTKNFTDFASATISNYETDIFRPIFDELEELSGKKYRSTLPLQDFGRSAEGQGGKSPFEHPKSVGEGPERIIEVEGATEKGSKTNLAASMGRIAGNSPGETTSPEARAQLDIDIAFRVIADHIRTLSFAIADGIQPGNTDRNYVLRRILRRAVRYGRTLGFHEPFFFKLVDVVADTMGDVFPEIREKKKHVQNVIRIEEEAFNRTLDVGLLLFEQIYAVRQSLDKTARFTRWQFDNLDGIAKEFSSYKELTPELEAEYEERLQTPHSNLITAFSVDAGGAVPNAALDIELLKEAFPPKDNEFIQVGLKLMQQLLSMGKDAITEDRLIERTKRLVEKQDALRDLLPSVEKDRDSIPGRAAFLLYDTYGFPLDLTELLARERGLTVDVEGFNKLMEEQRERARKAQKREVIELSQIETTTPTRFVGFDQLETQAKVLEVVSLKDKTAVVLDTSACYAEMGGQVGDAGQLYVAADVSPQQTATEAGISAALSRVQPRCNITKTQKTGDTWLHFVEGEEVPDTGQEVIVCVNARRREAIQRHHTVTHLFHWALHEVVSREAAQKGSYVGPDKLTFDFNSAPLTPQQIADIEKLVNERILENAPVSWTEVPYAEVRNRDDVMQFFGDKYGDIVRVVQIGGRAGELDGYSMELCGGTHTRATGEIGLFRIVGESAIAAGVRRVEAVAGLEAYQQANQQLELIKSIAGKVNSPVGELERKIESMLAQQKELEKSLKAAKQREAAQSAKSLVASAETVNGVQLITKNLGDAEGDTLQAVADALKGEFKGVVVLGGVSNGAVALVATVAPKLTKRIQAGKLIQQIAPIVGGKGGGRPDNARGGGRHAGKLDEALARVESLLAENK